MHQIEPNSPYIGRIIVCELTATSKSSGIASGSTACEKATPGVTIRGTARAGNRRFWLLSSLHAHTKAPYKNDLL